MHGHGVRFVSWKEEYVPLLVLGGLCLRIIMSCFLQCLDIFPAMKTRKQSSALIPSTFQVLAMPG